MRLVPICKGAGYFGILGFIISSGICPKLDCEVTFEVWFNIADVADMNIARYRHSEHTKESKFKEAETYLRFKNGVTLDSLVEARRKAIATSIDENDDNAWCEDFLSGVVLSPYTFLQGYNKP